MSMYEKVPSDELVTQFKEMRDKQNQEIQLAISIRAENPMSGDAKKQSQVMEQEAIYRYSKHLSEMKKELISRDINPDEL